MITPVTIAKNLTAILIGIGSRIDSIGYYIVIALAIIAEYLDGIEL
jgi:hypothetical protein